MLYDYYDSAEGARITRDRVLFRGWVLDKSRGRALDGRMTNPNAFWNPFTANLLLTVVALAIGTWLGRR